jgi:hypothetical protein
MPRFTLIKHPEGKYDTEVTVAFECEMVDVAKAHYDDFLQGAGFSLPDEAPFERKLTPDDFLAKEEDWQWNDAFSAKFNVNAAEPVRMDGLVGGAGADVIDFGDYKKEPFIPTFHD